MSSAGASRRGGRVVVGGGGLSGLVAARCLAGSFEVVLAEAAPRVGGVLRTVELRGRPVDTGADSFLTRVPVAEALCRELGLGDHLLAPATTRAAVFRHGALRPIPAGAALGVPTRLVALWRSRSVSPFAVLRAGRDLLPFGARLPEGLGAATEEADLSVASALEPRLGWGVVAGLVDPLLGGIHAGEVRSLSLKATAPELARALSGGRRVMASLRPLARRPPTGTTSFLGLVGGIGELAKALADDCVRRGVELRLAAPLAALVRDGSAWRAVVGDEELHCDGVLLALPGPQAAALLDRPAPELSAGLATIPHAGVVTVTLAFARSALERPDVLALSGVLVPRGEMLSTAVTFTSTKWPRSASDEEIVVRASAGRFGDERALGLDDRSLVETIVGEVAAVTGLRGAPLGAHVERFPDSFPQPLVGHLGRLAVVDELAARLGTLSLAGARAGGVGIPSCIATAAAAATRLAAHLAR